MLLNVTARCRSVVKLLLAMEESHEYADFAKSARYVHVRFRDTFSIAEPKLRT